MRFLHLTNPQKIKSVKVTFPWRVIHTWLWPTNRLQRKRISNKMMRLLNSWDISHSLMKLLMLFSAYLEVLQGFLTQSLSSIAHLFPTRPVKEIRITSGTKDANCKTYNWNRISTLLSPNDKKLQWKGRPPTLRLRPSSSCRLVLQTASLQPGQIRDRPPRSVKCWTLIGISRAKLNDYKTSSHCVVLMVRIS